MTLDNGVSWITFIGLMLPWVVILGIVMFVNRERT